MDQSLATQLQTTLNTVPAFTWYSLPSGTLTFVNHRYADYLGLASDHPLRFGVETGVAWDTHLQLLHPDDHESSRTVGETILRSGGAGQAAFRVRDASGVYRWLPRRGCVDRRARCSTSRVGRRHREFPFCQAGKAAGF